MTTNSELAKNGTMLSENSSKLDVLNSKNKTFLKLNIM